MPSVRYSLGQSARSAAVTAPRKKSSPEPKRARLHHAWKCSTNLIASVAVRVASTEANVATPVAFRSSVSVRAASMPATRQVVSSSTSTVSAFARGSITPTASMLGERSGAASVDSVTRELR